MDGNQIGILGCSICIVARNEEARIERCLASLITPTYPNIPFEIQVFDNASTDGTCKRIEAFAASHPSISFTLHRRSQNHLGEARAQALLGAQFEKVAFIDADCVAPPAWLDRLSAEWERADEKTAAIGSGNRPERDSPWGRARAAMFSTAIGSMGTVQAGTPSTPLVDHLPTCNVMYSRRALLESGNFSGSFALVCEDLELSHRLRARGFSLRYAPGIDVTHDQGGPTAWARRMFRYGYGQIQVAFHHPRHLLGVKALPLAALLANLAFALTSFNYWLFAIAIYLATVAFWSWLLARRSPGANAPLIFALFVTTHAFYAAGEAFGVFRAVVLSGRGRADEPRSSKDSGPPSRLPSTSNESPAASQA